MKSDNKNCPWKIVILINFFTHLVCSFDKPIIIMLKWHKHHKFITHNIIYCVYKSEKYKLGGHERGRGHQTGSWNLEYKLECTSNMCECVRSIDDQLDCRLGEKKKKTRKRHTYIYINRLLYARYIHNLGNTTFIVTRYYHCDFYYYYFPLKLILGYTYIDNNNKCTTIILIIFSQLGNRNGIFPYLEKKKKIW